MAHQQGQQQDPSAGNDPLAQRQVQLDTNALQVVNQLSAAAKQAYFEARGRGHSHALAYQYATAQASSAQAQSQQSRGEASASPMLPPSSAAGGPSVSGQLGRQTLSSSGTQGAFIAGGPGTSLSASQLPATSQEPAARPTSAQAMAATGPEAEGVAASAKAASKRARKATAEGEASTAAERAKPKQKKNPSASAGQPSGSSGQGPTLGSSSSSRDPRQLSQAQLASGLVVPSDNSDDESDVNQAVFHEPRASTPEPSSSAQELLKKFAEFSPGSRQELLLAISRVPSIPSSLDGPPNISGVTPVPSSSIAAVPAVVSQPSSVTANLYQTQDFSGTSGPSAQAPMAASLPLGPFSSSIGQGLSRSMSAQDPHLLLGYNPEGKVSSDMVQLPCQATVNKVANSMFIELYHFTPAGIAAGYQKNPMSETGKRLGDLLGAEIQLPAVKILDEHMSFDQAYRATKNHVATIRHAARQQIDPTKKMILSNEAEVWKKAYEDIMESLRPWHMKVVYLAILRQQYYLSTVGSQRPNPSLWQDDIWQHVRSMFEDRAGASPATVPSLLGSVTLPSGGQGGVYAASYGGGVGGGHSSGFGGGYGSGHSGFPGGGGGWNTPGPAAGGFYQVSGRGRGRSGGGGGFGGSSGSRPKPFPPSSQGASRSASGAICIICGRSQDIFRHEFRTCNGSPAGRGQAHCWRNDQGHLFRRGDNVAVCMSYNRGVCNRPTDKCYNHECSLCGSQSHGAQQCSLTQGAAGGGGGAQRSA
ncbi:hypothetical protein OC835_007443 [Tilletia horrida]|nr:hypothetical protein OC835_007443 [Tilletia horrida]